MLKFLCAFTFLVFLNSVDAQVNWSQQASGTTIFLSSVDFINDNVGIVIGGSGTILKTIDGGNNWIKINSGTTVDFATVCFVNNNIAFISGDNGVILKTTDGGNNWSPLNSGVSSMLYSINFIDPNIGYAAGMGGTILKTTNGGATWTQQNSHITNHIYRISFLNKDTGFIAAKSGSFARTLDGGSTWVPINSGTSYDLSYVSFYNKSIGFITGDYGTILKSINCGSSWTSMNSGTSIYLNNAEFINSNSAYTVGLYGTILKTTDGGQNWINDNSGVTNRLVSICFPSQNIGYAVGANGCILKNKPPCSGPKPIINIGNDTSYCGAFNRIIDAGISGNYLWSTKETTRSIKINSGGKYSVEVITPNNCILTDTILINQFSKPIINIGNDTSYCGVFKRILDAGISGNYLWSTGATTRTIEITQSGQYYVIVKSANCYSGDTININNLPLTQIMSIDTTIQGQITIHAQSGTLPYQFSMDGIHFQSNETFSNVTPGDYIITVKDKNSCRTSQRIKIYDDLITIPNFFTPNGDGVHDTWEIKEIHTYPNATIQIFDRFGKLLITYKGSERGWDGYYNKMAMKSDDYWYLIDLNFDNKTYTGHVTLIR